MFQPDIWIVDAEGEMCVWKSWWRRSAVERYLLARRLARREGRIIGALEDLEGFPKFLGHPDPYTVAMSRLPAEPVPEEKGTSALSPLYFDRLEALLNEMHLRGINHGDLRRKNLLRVQGDPDTPCVVDFTQCLYMPPPRTFFGEFIFREAMRIDRVTFLKLKKWYIGKEELSGDEVVELGDVPWHLSVGRFLRKRLYRPVRRWWRNGGRGK